MSAPGTVSLRTRARHFAAAAKYFGLALFKAVFGSAWGVAWFLAFLGVVALSLRFGRTWGADPFALMLLGWGTIQLMLAAAHWLWRIPAGLSGNQSTRMIAATGVLLVVGGLASVLDVSNWVKGAACVATLTAFLILHRLDRAKSATQSESSHARA